MRAALAYAPRPGPLGGARPSIAAAYLGPLAVISFSFSSPAVLVACGLTAIGIAAASGAVRPALAPLRYGVTLAVTVIIVNVIVSQRGDTILIRGFELPVLGQIDVTLEALAEGAILALRILVALLVFAVWSACVDPDRILKAIRPFAARSAITATLISRLVPLAAADSMRLQEAASLRGPAASEAGRAAIARRLVAGALERSVEVAATLELRGFGLGGRPSKVRHRRLPGEQAMLVSGTLMALLIIAAALAGAGTIETYPLISGGFEPETLAFTLMIPVIAALPFCSRRELRRLRAEREARR
jgi:energy-coupling factor transport system permease protein